MKKNCLLLLFLVTAFSFLAAGSISEAKGKNYTISPKSKILAPYTRSHNVNKYTKHWFLITSYLEKMEKKGGGTLTLKKGTYKICNSLYTPSNTTVILKDGVKIVKINKAGKADFKPAESIFQVTTPTLRRKKKKAKKYNGAKNVSIIGEGNATIDLKYIKNAKGIIVAHCTNVTVENIRFSHLHTGHFIEMDAAKNVSVKNCVFRDVAKKSPYNKEAINVDTPDATTGGLNLAWSNPDKTPNDTVVIENCKFSNLKRGVGTHKYSQKNGVNCYHTGITIQNNTFEKISDTGIFLMNWQNTSILNNTFTSVKYCMDFRGAQAPFSLLGNNFGSCKVTQGFSSSGQLIQRNPYKNTGPGKQYSSIKNKLGVTTIPQLIAMNKGEDYTLLPSE